MFSCLVILISFGIKNGINNGINNLLKGYQNYNSFKISKIDYEIINNSSLKMQKTSLPTIEEVENITKQYENCEIKSNLDYFFSNEIDVNIAGKNFNEVKFIPVNNIKTSNVVYVNKSFKKLYESKCDGSCLNKLINVHLKREIHNNTIHTYNEGIITENFDVFLTFDIEQINTEFDYLNYPKAYFSYDFFINKLSNLEAINSTKITNKKVTFLDILNSEYNDEISDYKKLIYFDTFDDSLNFYNQFDNRIFAVESENFNTVKSFSELIQALIEGGKIFIGVAAICSILVVVFLSYYSFVFNRKESAILTSLGMEENSLIMIYILEQLLMTFFGVIFSYFLMKIIQKPLNILIYNNTYFRDLVMVNFSSKTLLLFLIFAMGLVFICLYFPLSFSKKIEISKELKEE